MTRDRSSPRRRWKRALGSVVAAEGHQGIGRRTGWRRLTVGSRFALRSPIEPVRPLFEAVGGKQRHLDETGQLRVWSRTQAPMVRIGKFDVDDVARLRAFYPDVGLALRLQRADDTGPGVARELEARRTIADHAPGLAPPVVGHGAFGGSPGIAYLFEELLPARQLNAPELISEGLGELAARLTELHRGFGVGSRRLDEVISPKVPTWWSAVVPTLEIDPAIDAAVQELFERNQELEISFGHGDLVGSNILRADGRIVLVDWEHSQTMPIAFDLAKPLLQSADPTAALDVLRDVLAPTVPGGPDSFALEEQLALAYVRTLSGVASRRERAAAAGRLEALERETQQRITLVAALLDV